MSNVQKPNLFDKADQETDTFDSRSYNISYQTFRQK